MHKEEGKKLAELIDILKQLRQKCPWDKAQTMASLTQQSIEEIYELCEAIYDNNTEDICKELGDVLMHILFYSLLAEENNDFQFIDVIKAITKKLKDRHPHIFHQSPSLSTPDEVLQQWQKLKKTEGQKYTMEGIAKALPSITKALRIQDKAKNATFDFSHLHETWEKIEEEKKELEIAVKENKNKEEELGDLLFAIINYARHLNIDPEKALQKANQKFITRFTQMEKYTLHNKTSLDKLSIEEKNLLWERVKSDESKHSAVQ